MIIAYPISQVADLLAELCDAGFHVDLGSNVEEISNKGWRKLLTCHNTQVWARLFPQFDADHIFLRVDQSSTTDAKTIVDVIILGGGWDAEWWLWGKIQ